MLSGYVEKNPGDDCQYMAMLSFWCLQDGMGGGHVAVAFTEMSEKAVIRWIEQDHQHAQVLEDPRPMDDILCREPVMKMRITIYTDSDLVGSSASS